MKRRGLLTSTGLTLTTALAGCLADGSSNEETLSVTEPTVKQGETANISIEAPNLSGLSISDFPEEFHPEGNLQLGEATFTPSPDVVWEVFPPHWGFSGRDTEGDVPIQTSSETPPDTYRFSFAFQIDGDEEPRHKETTVTVESESS